MFYVWQVVQAQAFRILSDPGIPAMVDPGNWVKKVPDLADHLTHS